jgi:Protein of unknown function (DUF1573)
LILPFADAQEAAISSERPIADAFTSSSLQVTPSKGALSTAVEWSYTNHWNFPLLIERVDTSCGCLTAYPDQQPLAPAATGKLRATLTVGSLRGAFRKNLSVRFVGHALPVEISVEATIPTAVALSTQNLSWSAEDSISTNPTKLIEVTTQTETNFSITGLLGVDESQFTIVQKTILPDRHYQLHVTPAQSHPSVPITSALHIRTNSPDPRDQVLLVVLSQFPKQS